jgi:hypothetical protein
MAAICRSGRKKYQAGQNGLGAVKKEPLHFGVLLSHFCRNCSLHNSLCSSQLQQKSSQNPCQNL